MLRSKELDDIIGRPPHWLVQWGITLFFSIILLVFALSYFIRYPEIVNAQFLLHGDPAPAAISVKSAGNISGVKMQPGNMARKGDTLFQYLENGSGKTIAVIAPVDGMLVLIAPINIGTHVVGSKTLFYLVPQAARFDAGMYLSSADIKKIKPGQQVTLTFNDYASAEYGTLDGTIAYVSSLAIDKGFYVKIDLPQQLRSNIGKQIPQKEGLAGQARIVIEKKRLLSKFLKRKID